MTSFIFGTIKHNGTKFKSICYKNQTKYLVLTTRESADLQNKKPERKWKW